MAKSDTKSSAKVPYTSSVRMMRSGRFFTMAAICASTSSLSFTEGGLLGLHRKKALTFGSSSLSSSFLVNCQLFSIGASISTSTSW